TRAGPAWPLGRPRTGRSGPEIEGRRDGDDGVTDGPARRGPGGRADAPRGRLLPQREPGQPGDPATRLPRGAVRPARRDVARPDRRQPGDAPLDRVPRRGDVGARPDALPEP